MRRRTVTLKNEDQDDFYFINRNMEGNWCTYAEIKAQNFQGTLLCMQYSIVNGHSTYFLEFFFSFIVCKRSVQYYGIYSPSKGNILKKHKGALSQLQSNSIADPFLHTTFLPSKCSFQKAIWGLCMCKYCTIYIGCRIWKSSHQRTLVILYFDIWLNIQKKKRENCICVSPWIITKFW